MDFSAALDNLKKGRKVRQGESGLILVFDSDSTKILYMFKDFKTWNWTPTQNAILALDWEVVE